MGANVQNVELVKDYADGRHFIRLHRDVNLPEEVYITIRGLLDAGEWETAKEIALEHAPTNAREELTLFFDSIVVNCSA